MMMAMAMARTTRMRMAARLEVQRWDTGDPVMVEQACQRLLDTRDLVTRGIRAIILAGLVVCAAIVHQNLQSLPEDFEGDGMRLLDFSRIGLISLMAHNDKGSLAGTSMASMQLGLLEGLQTNG